MTVVPSIQTDLFIRSSKIHQSIWIVNHFRILNMKGFIVCATILLAATLTSAGIAEKVSEDDNFVVYRIPVRSLPDLQSQASGLHEGLESFTPMAHGRSSSKSASSSKSSSSSTGSGRGKGYGEGSSSHGHGSGTGGSSSGYGHGGGGSSSGYGHGGGGSGYGGGSSGHGSGYGGSGGHGSGYGGGSSGHGSGYGGGSSGHGSGYGGGSSGHGSGYGGGSSGHGSGYGGSEPAYGGRGYTAQSGYGSAGSASYTPHYEGQYNGPQYDEEEPDHPKITTTTKSFTTNSATNTGGPSYRREPQDSLGDISFRLGDYLKNTPGHEGSKYSQKIHDGYGAGDYAAPGFRSGQGFNVNEFTRSLNHGMTGYKSPSYRNSRFVPQASVVYPMAFGLRNAGFGLGGF